MVDPKICVQGGGKIFDGLSPQLYRSVEHIRWLIPGFIDADRYETGTQWMSMRDYNAIMVLRAVANVLGQHGERTTVASIPVLIGRHTWYLAVRAGGRGRLPGLQVFADSRCRPGAQMTADISLTRRQWADLEWATRETIPWLLRGDDERPVGELHTAMKSLAAPTDQEDNHA